MFSGRSERHCARGFYPPPSTKFSSPPLGREVHSYYLREGMHPWIFLSLSPALGENLRTFPKAASLLDSSPPLGGLRPNTLRDSDPPVGLPLFFFFSYCCIVTSTPLSLFPTGSLTGLFPFQKVPAMGLSPQSRRFLTSAMAFSPEALLALLLCPRCRIRRRKHDGRHSPSLNIPPPICSQIK